VLGCLGLRLLGGERAGQPLLLGRVQPLRVGGAILEVEPGDDADDDRGDRDAEEHEAPALEAEEHAVLLDQQARERGADDRGEGLGQVEEREDLAAVRRGDPEAQEEDGTGEEAGLGDAEQEAEHDELLEVLHPREEGRDDAPAHHDAGEPLAGAELVEREVRGHLEQDVADEEDARGEAELGGRQGEILVHAVGGGEADGGAVEVVDEEHQRDEGHQADGDLADGGLRDGGLRVGSEGGVHADSCFCCSACRDGPGTG
jgi:hypothetical protein